MNQAPSWLEGPDWPTALDWAAERDAWPHADASRFLRAGGLGWHVQRWGSGPELLLLHGTGASTHSWRDVASILAERWCVIVPDLPGHGFSERPPERLSLPVMAGYVQALVAAMDLTPKLAIGHSAGAAILVRCALDGALQPVGLVAINGALLPFRGAAGFLFPTLARLLALNPLVPLLVARSAANPDRVRRLIRDTGTNLDDAGLAVYARLFRSRSQVAAVLSMMANWDLERLGRDLPQLALPLLLLVGDNDRAITPSEADRVVARVRHARVECLAGVGHLAHEEDPAAVVARIEAFATDLGLAKHGQG